jgi:hydroxymethylglutaryl-CoA reductase (NADPH)
MARPPSGPQPQTLRHRISSALLGGEKGSSLPEYARGLGIQVKGGMGKVAGLAKDEQVRPENPVARLKLLLVSYINS